MEYVKLSLAEYNGLKEEAKRHEEAFDELVKSLEEQDKIFKISSYARWNSNQKYTFCDTVKSELDSLNNQIKMLEKELDSTWITRLKSRLCRLLNCDCK